MNKKTLELRTLILTAIVLTLTIVSIIGMIIFFNKVTSEKQANFYFDVCLSFITSLFSAMIAYIVAVIQVKSSLNLEKESNLRQNIKDIGLILIEMEDNIEVLDISINCLKEEPDETISENQFSSDMWERLINKIDIPNDLMADFLRVMKKKELIFCNEKVSLQELTDFKKEYMEIYNNLEKLKQQFNWYLGVY